MVARLADAHLGGPAPREGGSVSSAQDDTEAGLIDLSGMSLRDLDKLDGSSLAHELRQLLESDSGDAETISGFNDSI